MSADEKRKVILDIYHKTKSVYTEKEILTLACKAGVNSNTYVVVQTIDQLTAGATVDSNTSTHLRLSWSLPTVQFHRADQQQILAVNLTLTIQLTRLMYPFSLSLLAEQL